MSQYLGVGAVKCIPPFLNSLRYTDHTLESFFKLARIRSYFKDTIFIFLADHARTGDKFNLANQHHIPLLLYAPGYVAPGVNSVVGNQVDLLPTILSLLHLKTTHASWGRNLLELGKDQGFAVCISGSETRWHDGRYLLNDSLTDDRPPFLFDLVKDPDCTTDIWQEREKEGEVLRTRLLAYISLSQSLLHQNRVYP